MARVVMVVEGSPELRRMLEEGLEIQGYVVTSACTPEEALDALRRHPADLLIADPGTRNGRAANRSLEALHEEFPGVPSIVVSCETPFDPASLHPDGDHAPRAVLRRPFTLGELLRLTGRLLGERSTGLGPH